MVWNSWKQALYSPGSQYKEPVYKTKKRKNTVLCPYCTREVHRIGLEQHIVDKGCILTHPYLEECYDRVKK